MEIVQEVYYRTKDGRRFHTAEAAAEHEWELDREAERVAHSNDIWRTPDGLWSVRCENCGKRTLRPYSDDYVWCLECQYDCWNNGGHTPDDDSPDVCFVCGGDVKEQEETDYCQMPPVRQST